jgi:hypothetical protein
MDSDLFDEDHELFRASVVPGISGSLRARIQCPRPDRR